MDDSLFIGLVTHPRSRFPEAAGPDGLSAKLARDLSQYGWDVTTAVHSKNSIAPDSVDLSWRGITRSIHLEMCVERQWARFQRRRGPLTTVGTGAVLLSRELYRFWKFARPTKSSRRLAQQSLLRLANIESAHLSLMVEGEASDTQWVLLIEDDAHSVDVQQLSKDMRSNLEKWSTTTQPLYVNVSRSFTLNELKVGKTQTAIGPWSPTSTVVSSNVPFTNTVCAVVYRREFLCILNKELADIPLEPIIPIDWKLNLALMRLFAKGLLGPGDCYTIDPAPILQGSMMEDRNQTGAG